MSEDDRKILKRSKIPDEKFVEHFDVLLRVLSFVKLKEGKVYRRKAWPGKRNSSSETLFVAPGETLKYPDEAARAKGNSATPPFFFLKLTVPQRSFVLLLVTIQNPSSNLVNLKEKGIRNPRAMNCFC